VGEPLRRWLSARFFHKFSTCCGEESGWAMRGGIPSQAVLQPFHHRRNTCGR
jgi:hypothetical protein